MTPPAGGSSGGSGRGPGPTLSPAPEGPGSLGWRFPFPPAAPPALASPVGRVLAFLVVAIALTGLGIAVDSVLAAVIGMAALGLGIAVCHAVPEVREWFRYISGWLVGLIVATVYVAIVGVIAAIWHTVLPLEPAPYLGLVAAGLDWQRADRLRPSVFLSGLFLLPLISAKTEASLVVALLWLGAALATLWILQSDTDRGQRRAVPVQASSGAPTSDELPLRGGELLRILGSAALVSVALALLIGNPSCSSQTGRVGGANGQYGQGGGYIQGGPYDPNSPFYDPNSPYYNPNSPYDDPNDPLYGNGTIFNPNRNDPSSPLYDPNRPTSTLGRSNIPTSTRVNPPIPGTPGSPGTPVSPGTPAASDSDSSDSLRTFLYVILGIGAFLALVAVVVTIYRRLQEEEDGDLEEPKKRRRGKGRVPTAREWARATLARLAAEGSTRGRPRRRSETIAQYCAALAGGVLPDERLLQVSIILDAALYGPTEPHPDERAWVDHVLLEIFATPAPERDSQHALTQ